MGPDGYTGGSSIKSVGVLLGAWVTPSHERRPLNSHSLSGCALIAKRYEERDLSFGGRYDRWLDRG